VNLQRNLLARRGIAPTLVAPPCLLERIAMREVTCCADNLVLLGEMLEAAADYIKQSIAEVMLADHQVQG
jgi:hypothetical protein